MKREYRVLIGIVGTFIGILGNWIFLETAHPFLAITVGVCGLILYAWFLIKTNQLSDDEYYQNITVYLRVLTLGLLVGLIDIIVIPIIDGGNSLRLVLSMFEVGLVTAFGYIAAYPLDNRGNWLTDVFWKRYSLILTILLFVASVIIIKL